MASSERQISSQNVDSQGFLIGEQRLAQMIRGIDQLADNTAEILAILQRDRDQRASIQNPPASQNQSSRTRTGRIIRILPDLPPTIHSNDARQGRQATNNAQGNGANNPPLPIPQSQVDRNQSARRNGIYNGDTVNSNEIRDRQRDTRGRFTGGNQSGGEGAGGSSTNSGIADAVKDGMIESAKVAAPQGVDPTLDALHEMGSAIEPLKGLFGKREKIPKEQARHNKIELKLLRRIAERQQNGGSGGGGLLGGGLLRILPMLLSGLGGIVGAVVSGLTAAAPIIAAALAAALLAWLAKKAWDKAGEIADEKRAPEQGDVNPDGSSNKGMVGLLNRGAKGIMNGVRGGLNSANEALGGDGDYWDDGTAPDSKNRVGLKTDAVNGGGGGVRPFKDKPLNVAVYDAYRKQGLSHEQALAITGEVGRENDFNSKIIFGKHTDPAKDGKGQNITNMGMLSWNRERAAALQAHLKQRGVLDEKGNMVKSQEALDAQAEFAVGEMKGKYKNKLSHFWENPTANPESFAKELGKDYVGWAYGQDTVKGPNGTRVPFNSALHDGKRRSYVDKTATDITTTMNDVISGRVKPVTATASTPPLANKLSFTTKTPFRPAQSMAGISQPVLPAPAQPIKLPDVPPVKQKLSSDAPMVVQLAGGNDNIGQNVGDRDLAHAITGGLGARK